ncbi:MAG: hypothetical protein RDU89_03640 [bacterium]|nr:hypothetical protein [bacterium]
MLLGLLRDGAAGYYDLAAYMRGRRRTRYIIWFCRSIAASLLAHAGLGGQEPVAAVARALLAASYRFVTGPAAAEPVLGSPPVIRPEAYDEELGYPAIPDLYLLELFAYSPAARSDPRLLPVLDYVFGPDYLRLGQGIGLIALEGKSFVKGWKITLPQPDTMLCRGMWAYGLTVLELMARLGAAGRYPATTGWLRWLAERQVRPGIYDLPASACSRHGPFAERVRLAPDWRKPDSRMADITFRLQLIRRLMKSGPVPPDNGVLPSHGSATNSPGSTAGST